MKSPTEEEFEESIKELSEYKNRLEEEVVTISQKLKMPQGRINSIVKSHKELNQIKSILSMSIAFSIETFSNSFNWDFATIPLDNLSTGQANNAAVSSIAMNKC